MEVVPYRAEHLLALNLQASQRWGASYITAEHAKNLEGEYAFSALVDGHPIVVGGVLEVWANRALLWSFIDQSAGAHFIPVHRGVKRFLEIVPHRRIEAECDVDFECGHRWLRMLGFTLEAERMRAFRLDGGDSALYAKVR